MRDDAIGYVLKAAPVAAECRDLVEWWPRFREAAQTWRNPMDRAIAAGFSADRVGWAFASGYQAALHALFPGVPEDRIAALCVTEADGNSPKAIRSSLRRQGDGWLLNGDKRWTTLGRDGALFFVAAQDVAVSGKRAAIRVVRVASDAPGVTVKPMPATRFVPEVPHAQLQFENVRLAENALLPGEGYDDYVKPFRTVEDLHVHAAVVAYLVREARRLEWPAAWIERATAALHLLRALAGEDSSAPATHVALAGALTFGMNLIDETEKYWNAAGPDPAAARWARDRELFGVASGARVQRTARAWERIKPS